MSANNTNPTIDANNFANNAFTDFAPLLTLFGDEVTKQFLATSMGFADVVLLGIAPIGLMTIIMSAIRVGGSRLMKSFIGRLVFYKPFRMESRVLIVVGRGTLPMTKKRRYCPLRRPMSVKSGTGMAWSDK